MINPKIESLKRDLKAAYEGSKWHSFKSAVNKLEVDEGLWKPDHYKGFPHMDGSILNIIFHLGGDSHYQLDHAVGNRALNWEILTQMFNEAGGDLESALKLAQDGYQNLQDALDQLSDEGLDSTYPKPEGGGERSLQDFFRMMIEHHHYHSGQIVYIRSLFKGISDNSET